MEHFDWSAWDAWMEANDNLVQQGIVPTCEEITRKSEFAKDCNDYATCDRTHNIENMMKNERDECNLEETRLRFCTKS